ncbi:uncharacterized protein [Elaeis guineensis]|uniref:Uncharacterized protein LOC114913921 n=1 Tax=Elaeis guineensis var. tenera TaxID=51953 RepID=A0A8N4F239_ELAGV|nr:uncharacterized protein LOC114913921 [Elaeis guineensis]
MEASFSLFYSGGMEGTTGFLLPNQRQQQQTMMGQRYFPARPMSNQALLQQHPAFLLSKLARARERAVQLEACLERAEEERKMWQRMAARHPLTAEEPREGTGMELCKDAL